MSFNDLGLSKELLRALEEKGYKIPTPIQSQAIPLVLSGHDLMAGSQTGTGKTAGFTLPILQKLLSKPLDKGAKRSPRALILAPTRELAVQIADSVRTYSKYLPLKTAAVFGGVNMHAQKKTLFAGVDVLIATPGRLLDHINQRTVTLSQVEVFVLDEADRMLDMGFIPDIKKILSLLPQTRQNLLFSATFSREIKTLAGGFLKNPQTIEAAQHNTLAPLISHTVYPVDQSRKKELLTHLIVSEQWKQVLVFTRTKHKANNLSEHLSDSGIKCTAIHGNKSQAARSRALFDFKNGKIQILVATDVAARGIDIRELPHVVNFELPYVPEDYIHRIGRTGRAGNKGEAISLVSLDEQKLLRDIERLLKQPIERKTIAGYELNPKATTEPLSRGRRRPSFPGKRPEHKGRPRPSFQGRRK